MVNNKTKKYSHLKKNNITLADIIELKRAGNQLKNVELKDNLYETFNKIWRSAY